MTAPIATGTHFQEAGSGQKMTENRQTRKKIPLTMPQSTKWACRRSLEKFNAMGREPFDV